VLVDRNIRSTQEALIVHDHYYNKVTDASHAGLRN
jgi:hypothetical protein